MCFHSFPVSKWVQDVRSALVKLFDYNKTESLHPLQTTLTNWDVVFAARDSTVESSSISIQPNDARSVL